ncbi:MAG TPA: DUF1559 domain-containing protein [Pirellulaceae bacterium]|nr:DUF1559 domain-containing protein [Pirellulaceae bacterium]
MNVNPYESPETPGAPPEKKAGRRFTLVELLVVVVLIGLLIACLLPARRSATEAGRRMSCQNNLHEIGLALEQYHDVYGSFPPAYTVDADGKRLHSWRTLILPYLEEKFLYDKIDLSKPWNDPANQFVLEARIGTYQCPSADIPKNHTTYLVVVANSGCFRGAEPRKREEVTEDHNRALLVIEVPADRAVPWMSPHDADVPSFLTAVAADKPAHPSGMQVVCVDGTIHTLSADIEPNKLRAMISVAGDDETDAAGEK